MYSILMMKYFKLTFIGFLSPSSSSGSAHTNLRIYLVQAYTKTKYLGLKTCSSSKFPGPPQVPLLSPSFLTMRPAEPMEY